MEKVLALTLLLAAAVLCCTAAPLHCPTLAEAESSFAQLEGTHEQCSPVKGGQLALEPIPASLRWACACPYMYTQATWEGPSYSGVLCHQRRHDAWTLLCGADLKVLAAGNAAASPEVEPVVSSQGIEHWPISEGTFVRPGATSGDFAYAATHVRSVASGVAVFSLSTEAEVAGALLVYRASAWNPNEPNRGILARSMGPLPLRVALAVSKDQPLVVVATTFLPQQSQQRWNVAWTPKLVVRTDKAPVVRLNAREDTCNVRANLLITDRINLSVDSDVCHVTHDGEGNIVIGAENLTVGGHVTNTLDAATITATKLISDAVVDADHIDTKKVTTEYLEYYGSPTFTNAVEIGDNRIGFSLPSLKRGTTVPHGPISDGDIVVSGYGLCPAQDAAACYGKRQRSAAVIRALNEYFLIGEEEEDEKDEKEVRRGQPSSIKPNDIIISDGIIGIVSVEGGKTKKLRSGGGSEVTLKRYSVNEETGALTQLCSVDVPGSVDRKEKPHIARVTGASSSDDVFAIVWRDDDGDGKIGVWDNCDLVVYAQFYDASKSAEPRDAFPIYVEEVTDGDKRRSSEMEDFAPVQDDDEEQTASASETRRPGGRKRSFFAVLAHHGTVGMGLSDDKHRRSGGSSKASDDAIYAVTGVLYQSSGRSRRPGGNSNRGQWYYTDVMTLDAKNSDTGSSWGKSQPATDPVVLGLRANGRLWASFVWSLTANGPPVLYSFSVGDNGYLRAAPRAYVATDCPTTSYKADGLTALTRIGDDTMAVRYSCGEGSQAKYRVITVSPHGDSLALGDSYAASVKDVGEAEFPDEEKRTTDERRGGSPSYASYFFYSKPRGKLYSYVAAADYDLPSAGTPGSNLQAVRVPVLNHDDLFGPNDAFLARGVSMAAVPFACNAVVVMATKSGDRVKVTVLPDEEAPVGAQCTWTTFAKSEAVVPLGIYSASDNAVLVEGYSTVYDQGEQPDWTVRYFTLQGQPLPNSLGAAYGIQCATRGLCRFIQPVYLGRDSRSFINFGSK